MPQKITKAKQATAYREAGHAVAAFLLKWPFRYVTIVPDEETATLGHIILRGFGANFHPEYDDSPNIRLRLERAIMCALAGDAAEATFRGRHNRVGTTGDFQSAVDYVLYLSGSREEAGAYLIWLGIRIRNMLEQQYNRAMVEGLATALLEHEHIPYQRTREIIRESGRQFTQRQMEARGITRRPIEPRRIQSDLNSTVQGDSP